MTSKIESATFYPAFTQEFSGIELSNTKNSVETEKLHEYITYDPISEETSNRRWKLAWQVAGLITAISIATFAIITVSFTAAYHLAQLPLILIILTLALPILVRTTHNYIHSKIISYHKKEKLASAISNKLKEFNDSEKLNDANFAESIQRIGFSLNTEINPLLLKNVYARFCVYIDKNQKLYEKSRATYFVNPDNMLNIKINKKIMQINPSDFKLDVIEDSAKNIYIFEKIQKQLSLAHDYNSKVADGKLRAAYCLKIMQAPYEKQKFSEFFKKYWDITSKISLQNRLTSEYFDETNLYDRPFIYTQKKRWSINKLFELKLIDISREVFQLEVLAQDNLSSDTHSE